jgi:hypothetical protein
MLPTLIREFSSPSPRVPGVPHGTLKVSDQATPSRTFTRPSPMSACYG